MIDFRNLIADAVVRGWDTAFTNGVSCDGPITDAILEIPEVKALFATRPQVTQPVLEPAKTPRTDHMNKSIDRIKYVIKDETLDIATIQAKTRLSPSTIKSVLASLHISGQLVRTTSHAAGRGRPKFLYRLA